MNFFMGGGFPAVAAGQTGTPAATTNMNAAAAAAAMYGMNPQQQATSGASATAATPMVNPFAAAAAGTAGVQGFNLNPSVAAAATYNPYQQAFNQSMMAAAAASQQNYAAYMAAANFQQQMTAAAAANASNYKGNAKPQSQTSVANSRQYSNVSSNQNTSGSNDTSNVSSTSFSSSSTPSSKTSSYSTSGSYNSGGNYSKSYNSYSSGNSSSYSSNSSNRYNSSGSNNNSSRSATGSNSHPVSYNKTLTGSENNFDRNSSGSFYQRNNSGSSSSNSYTSPIKVGYVPNKTSSTSNSETTTSSSTVSSSSNSRQQFSSNDSSSYQRRWNNYNDRNQSYGGGSREGGGGSREGGGGSREGGGGSREGGSGFREGGSSHGNYVPRGPLHYCDVCKISCAGPQTYKEHLEGQKHKKKEQQLKAGIVPEQNQPQQQQHFKPGQKTFYCELCDVTCTSADTYNAHARGAKHLKCVKLYQKMNKPIPPAKEVIVNAAGEEPTVVTHKVAQEQPRGYSGGGFGGNKFASSGSGGHSGNEWNRGGNYGNRASYGSSNGSGEKEAANSTTLKGLSSKITPVSDSVKSVIDAASSTTYVEDGLLKDECDPDPVGGEYIEETRCPETNKLIEFNCKLCDCKFNDPHAKDMHLKGRRHRIMYKRKVNPDLEVEVKPGFRNKKLMEDRERSRRQREFLHRRLAEDHYSRMQMRRMEEELYLRVPAASLGTTFESWDDRHIMAKHSAIYPSDEELEAVQLIVGRAEKVLKVVSDKLALEDMKDPEIRKRVLAGKGGSTATTETAKSNNATKEAVKSETASESTTGSETKTATKPDETEKSKPDEIDSAFRQVKGVMRIGALAKGLLLRGDKLVELAVLCQDRPTKTLLARIFKSLSQQMGELTSDKYSYEVKVQDCAILMTSQEDNYKIQLKASLTSPAVEVEEESGEGVDSDAKPTNPNLLSKARCLALLGELRRAKWFQTRAASVPACVVVTRILRDLIKRNPNWEQLPLWTMEVLVERTLGANQVPLSPGDALRRVFESISGGVLACREHSIGVGLVDPCENEVVDVTDGMKLQCREDVTASAQHALRQMVFKQIHKVLGMDMVSPPTQAQIRKRRMEQMEMMNKARGEQNVNNNVANRPPPLPATAPPFPTVSNPNASDGPNPAKRERFQDDAPGRVLPQNEKPAMEKDGKSEPMETSSSAVIDSNETVANASVLSETENQEMQNRSSKSESENPEFANVGSYQEPSTLSSSYEAVEEPSDAPSSRNENLVDPGGEAAYEAMSYEDPYESYYGPLPQYQNRMPFGGFGNPRFFRPWRGGGHARGGFYNRPPW